MYGFASISYCNKRNVGVTLLLLTIKRERERAITTLKSPFSHVYITQSRTSNHTECCEKHLIHHAPHSTVLPMFTCSNDIKRTDKHILQEARGKKYRQKDRQTDRNCKPGRLHDPTLQKNENIVSR